MFLKPCFRRSHEGFMNVANIPSASKYHLMIAIDGSRLSDTISSSLVLIDSFFQCCVLPSSIVSLRYISISCTNVNHVIILHTYFCLEGFPWFFFPTNTGFMDLILGGGKTVIA